MATSPPHRRVLLGLVASLLVAASGFAAAAEASTAANPPILYVTFQPDRTFSVSLADGTPVGAAAAPGTIIPAGSWQLLVSDTNGVAMQFDLAGPGVALVTNMTYGESLSDVFSVTFQPNSTYSFHDDLQPGAASSFFSTSSTIVSAPATTTSSSPTPSTSTAPASPPVTTNGTGSSSSGLSAIGTATAGKASSSPQRGTLVATVTRTGGLRLTLHGKGVAQLRSGRYTVLASDASPTSGFNLGGIGRNPVAVSGFGFVGKRSLSVVLGAGQWFFSSTHGKRTYFIVTT